MTKSGYLLVLATVLASPLSADRPADRREHEHDGQCGHEEPGNGGGHGRHRSVCGAVSVSVPERPHARDPFSVRKTLDLRFRMRVRTRDEESHVVSFRVLTPNGHLYQQLQAPPEAKKSKEKDDDRDDHDGRDDRDDHDDRDRSLSRVSARLPVAGTFIATSSLFGKWRVVPYIDDDPEPCAAPSVFRIEQ
jgi:hypothetical protein